MKRHHLVILITVFVLMFITFGFAYLNAYLDINGSTTIHSSSWNVYFDNVEIADGSVSGENEIYPATLESETSVGYSVVLPKMGDFYEFTVEVHNDGVIPAMIDVIPCTYKLGEDDAKECNRDYFPKYLKYTATYEDGRPIRQNQILDAGSMETFKVRIEYSKDVDEGDLAPFDVTAVLTFGVDYKQADETAVNVRENSVSFSDDSWDTVVYELQNNDACGSIYQVGDTKEIDLGEYGKHTIRIANCSRPAECDNSDYSQTACGVVLEFSDIITNKNMNSTNSNLHGWSISEGRNFTNYDIYNSLPVSLREGIIDTRVVSGHGSNYLDNENYITTDRLYLLSPMEVWGGYNSCTAYDSARDYTRQLDYYEITGVSCSSYSGAIKQNGGIDSWWWLRTPGSVYEEYYANVTANGSDSYGSANNKNGGFSPAFRLA